LGSKPFTEPGKIDNVVRFRTVEVLFIITWFAKNVRAREQGKV
jgi:hypothetical protein